MSLSPFLRLERQDDIAIVVLDNPTRMNPLGHDLVRSLRALLAQLRDDREVRALVLTGEGKAFSAGADLAARPSDPPDPRPFDEQTAEVMHKIMNPLIAELYEMPMPVVSAVNGVCAGGGIGVALAADVVLAARSAYFFLPFLPKLGLLPDMGSTWFLERTVGRARAQGMSLLGDRLPAEQAAAWGLIWACVDDASLREQTLAVARRLAKLPPQAALEARRAFAAAAHNSLPAQLHYEGERQIELRGRASYAEGKQAFLEKREPRFTR
jgi:2-(1,2-epoxy-1,2-dihydrophenyl)acetyl-CoA isomerase